jgi:homoserine O-acetyltransferase
MTDPNWHNGHYYDKDEYPLDGMRIAREIATLTYRSGPEWLERFGLRRFNDSIQLTPTFEIESYLQYQGVIFAKKYDPNSLLYISKVNGELCILIFTFMTFYRQWIYLI